MCNQQAEKETNKLGLNSSDILGIASSQGWGTKATQLWSSPVHEWLSHGLADKHMRLHPCSFAFNWLVKCLDWILAHFLSTGFRTDKADVSYKASAKTKPLGECKPDSCPALDHGPLLVHSMWLCQGTRLWLTEAIPFLSHLHGLL